MDDWFRGDLYSRLLIIAAAASALVAVARRSRPEPPVAATPHPSISVESRNSIPDLPAAELGLAIEHIQSIRVLLQVSASYNQPVPRAILVNLDLVHKNLRKLSEASLSTADESATERELAGPASTLAVES
jgi:hypothetical protein